MPIASLSDFSKEMGESDGANGKDLPPFGPGGIYHEKQVAAMCAVHCVNNMLQGPLFQYSDFGMVAQELDRAEARLTGGEGLGDGANARMDGFFNVQVMQAVLSRAGYTMQAAGGEDGLSEKDDTAKETAFILNKREHWFSLRRIGAEWFDLNSCTKTPSHYTPADVRFHIRDAIKQGYSVFVVRGNFPRCALEEDSKKLVEAVQGCGRPGQGYSLFAGGGQTLGGGAAAPPANNAEAMRAARLARLSGGAPPAPAPAAGTAQPASAVPPAPAPAPGTAQPVTTPAYTPAPTSAPPMPADPQVTTLVSMGFDEAAATAALRQANGNLEQATELLLGGAGPPPTPPPAPASAPAQTVYPDVQHGDGDVDTDLQEAMRRSMMEAEEEAKRKAEEEAKRKAEEAAAAKAAEEEMKRRAEEEEAQRKAEEAARQAEEDARRKAEEEAAAKAARQAEEDARRKAEEEAAAKAAEEDARRKAEEEAAAKAAEEDAKRKAEEEAAARAAEEEANLPEGWASAVDPSSGNTYYYNGATGQSQWTIPTAADTAETELLSPEARPEPPAAALQIATNYGLLPTAFQVSSAEEMSSFTLEGTPDEWVVVIGVTQGMWAESQGFQEGDILLTIGEQKVESMSEQEMKNLLSTLPAILTFGRVDEAIDEATLPASQIEAIDGMGTFGNAPASQIEALQIEAIDGMDTFVLLAERIEDHQTFELSGMPPHDWVTISSVHEGWATEQGLIEGDALIQIGETSVSQMDGTQLQSMLQTCPVYLVFGRVKGDDEAGHAAAVKIQSMQRGKEARKEVAELKARAQEEAAANSKAAAEAAAEEQQQQQQPHQQNPQQQQAAAVKIQSMQRAKKARKEVAALKAVKRRRKSAADPNMEVRPEPPAAALQIAIDYGLLPTALVVCNAQEMSSFTLEGSPPDEWVVVKSVTQGMWAESEGFQRGDILLTIGEKKVESMSEQEMKKLLSTYPAILTFGNAPASKDSASKDPVPAPAPSSDKPPFKFHLLAKTDPTKEANIASGDPIPAPAPLSDTPLFKFRPLAATDPRVELVEKDFKDGLQNFLARRLPTADKEQKEKETPDEKKLQTKDQQQKEDALREDVLRTKRQLLRLFLDREIRELGKNPHPDDLARIRQASRYLEKPDGAQNSDDSSPGSPKDAVPKQGKTKRGKPKSLNEVLLSPSQSPQQSPTAQSNNQSLSESLDLAQNLIEFLAEPGSKRTGSAAKEEDALLEELLRSKKGLFRHFVEREIREPAKPGSDTEATQLETLRRYLRAADNSQSPSPDGSPTNRQKSFTGSTSFGSSSRELKKRRSWTPVEPLMTCWYTKKRAWNAKMSTSLGEPNTKVCRAIRDQPGGGMAVGDGKLMLHKQKLTHHGYYWAFSVDELAEDLFPLGITRGMTVAFGVTQVAPQNLPARGMYAYDYPESTLVGYGGHFIHRKEWQTIPWEEIDLRVGDIVGNLITEEGEFVVFVNAEEVLRMGSGRELATEPDHEPSLYPVVDLCGRISSVTLLPKATPPILRMGLM